MTISQCDSDSVTVTDGTVFCQMWHCLSDKKVQPWDQRLCKICLAWVNFMPNFTFCSLKTRVLLKFGILRGGGPFYKLWANLIYIFCCGKHVLIWDRVTLWVCHLQFDFMTSKQFYCHCASIRLTVTVYRYCESVKSFQQIWTTVWQL